MLISSATHARRLREASRSCRRYQISISVSSSTPIRSATRLRTTSISCSTSRVVALGWATIKLACRWLTSAPPTRLALQPGLVDQHAGAHAARILEDAAGVLVGHRQVGLLDDPLLLHPLGDLVRIFFFELELGVEDHQLVEAALAIGEHEVVALARDDLAAAGHDGGAAGPLADVAAVRAGVAVQRAADRAGNADERFESGQARADRGGDHVGQLCAAADR